MTTADRDLPPELVAYYREVVQAHATDPGSGVCPVCRIAQCPDFVNAYDKLAAAHQVMTDAPPPWVPFRPGPKR